MERVQLDFDFNSRIKKGDKEKQLNDDYMIPYNENWISDSVEVFLLPNWRCTLVKTAWYAYKELLHIQLKDDHIRNDSVEYDYPSKWNNFKEHKSYQKSVVMLQWVNNCILIWCIIICYTNLYN